MREGEREEKGGRKEKGENGEDEVRKTREGKSKGRVGEEMREEKNGINDHTCQGLPTMHCRGWGEGFD